MTAIVDQPAPLAQPERTPVWALVIADYQRTTAAQNLVDPIDGLVLADMAERDRIGRERYGTPLTTDNGRDHLVDAYQECLDLAVYLRAWLEEHPRPGDDSEPPRLMLTRMRVKRMYKDQLNQLWDLRRLIADLAAPAGGGGS